ncbi:unnamed protein product [Blepharisma stoltei]|uniref:PHD and RING finger domain-containing protein 1 n=1 Tax=Blepharisma stoltei TaxID=1481888 RepID=A0AAU9IK98_9CILI|nr:unnamed protein product [Blepharisma stoltei]
MPKRLRKNTGPRLNIPKVCDNNGNLLNRCLICLESIEKHSALGILNCGHNQFCFSCLYEWSKVSNKCPLCNLKFNEIGNSKTSEVALVENSDKLIEDLYEEYISSIFCIRCGSDQQDEFLLICDGCDQGFHTFCIGINRIPDLEEWFCHDCILEKSTEVRKNQWREMEKAADQIEEEKARKRLKKLVDM